MRSTLQSQPRLAPLPSPPLIRRLRRQLTLSGSKLSGSADPARPEPNYIEFPLGHCPKTAAQAEPIMPQGRHKTAGKSKADPMLEG
jgi:hypothetical protein